MKKFLAFVMILSLGVFTAIGCSKPVEKPKDKGKAPVETKAPDTKAPETKAPETKAPEEKAPDTKAPEEKAPEGK
jgi:hypothetical protein